MAYVHGILEVNYVTSECSKYSCIPRPIGVLAAHKEKIPMLFSDQDGIQVGIIRKGIEVKELEPKMVIKLESGVCPVLVIRAPELEEAYATNEVSGHENLCKFTRRASYFSSDEDISKPYQESSFTIGDEFRVVLPELPPEGCLEGRLSPVTFMPADDYSIRKGIKFAKGDWAYLAPVDDKLSPRKYYELLSLKNLWDD